MNPFLFTGDESLPPGDPNRERWHPRGRIWKWPEDYRTYVIWLLALAGLAALVNVARGLAHPHWSAFPYVLLTGAGYYALSVAVWGIALWALWKEKSWARHWAVIASAMFLLDFFRQFILHAHSFPWDYRATSLLIGVVGVLAFSWPDKTANTSL
jgi:hypothetical protein